MPRKNKSKQNENTQITLNIERFMHERGIDAEKLATAARMGRTTFYLAMREPERFRLGQLRLIADKLKVTLNSIINGRLEVSK